MSPTAVQHLSSGGVPYGERVWFLRNVLLPLYTQWIPDLFSEVLVVGEFEPGPRYRYEPLENTHGNCADALLQRDRGFKLLAQRSEWILFQHDDHLWDPRNPPPGHTAADVISPARWTRARASLGEPLNDGSIEGHINGHACLMRPQLLEHGGFSWADVPAVFTWDLEVTERLRRLKANIMYASNMIVWDCERGAAPWA